MRYRVMRRLQDNPQMSQRELADELGVSLGATNYCLKALIEKGYVKAGNFRASKAKIKYVYILTPTGLAEKARLTKHFLKRKMQEYEDLKAEISTLQHEIDKEHRPQSDA